MEVQEDFYWGLTISYLLCFSVSQGFYEKGLLQVTPLIIPGPDRAELTLLVFSFPLILQGSHIGHID